MKNALYLLSVFALSASLHAQPHQRPAFDPEYPDVHDPVMARGEDGRYYIFATGFGIGVMSSADLKTWQQEKPVFAEAPTWAKDTVQGYFGHTCAPDIHRHGDLWYLYYSCSTFGKNGSAIGLATNRTLDPSSPLFEWKDQGTVVVSHKGRDNWNAIDPNLIIESETGRPYLVYGSFWDGIQLVELSKEDLRTPLTSPQTIARRIDQHRELKDITFTVENGRDTIEAGDNAIEAPFLIQHDGWYYLFVSWDYCCRGKNSTYKTVYGRSRSITGPFLDRDGRNMAQGGGTLLIGPTDRFYGRGHNSAYLFDGQWHLICHAYDSEVGARAKLQIHPFSFDKEGWIVFKE